MSQELQPNNSRDSLSSSSERQRNGRGENVFGVKEPLHSLQSSDVGTVGLSGLFVVVQTQHVGVTSRQRVHKSFRSPRDRPSVQNSRATRKSLWGNQVQI